MSSMSAEMMPKDHWLSYTLTTCDSTKMASCYACGVAILTCSMIFMSNYCLGNHRTQTQRNNSTRCHLWLTCKNTSQIKSLLFWAVTKHTQVSISWHFRTAYQSHLQWDQHSVPERWQTTTNTHCITTQKSEDLIYTVMEAWISNVRGHQKLTGRSYYYYYYYCLWTALPAELPVPHNRVTKCTRQKAFCK
jgi:hypothetical protein